MYDVEYVLCLTNRIEKLDKEPDSAKIRLDKLNCLKMLCEHTLIAGRISEQGPTQLQLDVIAEFAKHFKSNLGFTRNSAVQETQPLSTALQLGGGI